MSHIKLQGHFHFVQNIDIPIFYLCKLLISFRYQSRLRPSAPLRPRTDRTQKPKEKRPPGGLLLPIVNGKRMARNIYAATKEECEEKLAELIREMKQKIAAIKAQAKAG